MDRFFLKLNSNRIFFPQTKKRKSKLHRNCILNLCPFNIGGARKAIIIRFYDDHYRWKIIKTSINQSKERKLHVLRFCIGCSFVRSNTILSVFDHARTHTFRRRFSTATIQDQIRYSASANDHKMKESMKIAFFPIVNRARIINE